MTYTTDAVWAGPVPRTNAEALRRNLTAAAANAHLWVGAFTVQATEYGIAVQGSGEGCLIAAREFFGIANTEPTRTHVDDRGIRYSTWEVTVAERCTIALTESVKPTEAGQ